MADDRDTLAATKLTRTEFAVVRAYAQGMRPVDIANRYLVDPDDDEDLTEHQAIQRILALRDRLVQFALQHDRPDIAEMFEALRGRSDTGMSRRVEALSSIEQLGQGRPLPTHPVTLWFGPSLARRMVAAELRTVADLVALANRRGSSWWRHVPRIGRHSAETIVRWLRANDDGAGMRLRTFVRSPGDNAPLKALIACPLGPSMAYPVPFESMLPAPPFSLELAWVGDWLNTHQSRNTWLSYRREAERLLLWAGRNGLSLRDLNGESLASYHAFLADPQPSAFWCGPASPRDKMHWRPFEGPLRASSCAASLRVARVLLKEIRRRAGEPARSGIGSLGEARHALNVSNATPGVSVANTLTVSLPIPAFLDWLARDNPNPQQRAALAAALLIARHGVRVVELAALRLGDVEAIGDSGRLSLSAKSAARRKPMLLEPEAWEALRKHWADRGLPDFGERDWNAEVALLAPTAFPDTVRGSAKRGQRLAGYSASGLDRLLRASWKRFAAAHGGVPADFSPGRLRLN